MAKSNSHKFGQMIGDLLEVSMIKELRPIAEEFNMFLDFKHARKARSNKKEVVWIDGEGNKHKLDIVIEENGDEDNIGNPKAFIELAWRRYAKHSKNKAQEIAGAIIPLVNKYKQFSPFYGVVLAGIFTKPSIEQLKSQGFNVLHFSFDNIIDSFKNVGLTINWREDTSEEEIGEYVKFFENISQEDKKKFINYILEENKQEIEEFKNSLRNCFSRTIEKIRIFTLHGTSVEVEYVSEAIEYVLEYNENILEHGKLIKYELYIRYNNGDKIEVEFKDKRDIIRFLNEI